jgi:hypothetical protein
LPREPAERLRREKASCKNKNSNSGVKRQKREEEKKKAKETKYNFVKKYIMKLSGIMGIPIIYITLVAISSGCPVLSPCLLFASSGHFNHGDGVGAGVIRAISEFS